LNEYGFFLQQRHYIENSEKIPSNIKEEYHFTTLSLNPYPANVENMVSS